MFEDRNGSTGGPIGCQLGDNDDDDDDMCATSELSTPSHTHTHTYTPHLCLSRFSQNQLFDLCDIFISVGNKSLKFSKFRKTRSEIFENFQKFRKTLSEIFEKFSKFRKTRSEIFGKKKLLPVIIQTSKQSVKFSLIFFRSKRIINPVFSFYLLSFL